MSVEQANLGLCHVMCCDSETLLELCELHSISAGLIEQDAEAKHAKLLEFMRSRKHQRLELARKQQVNLLEKAMKLYIFGN